LYLDTFGSDITRLALCRLVACLSESNWPVHTLEPLSYTEPIEPSVNHVRSWWALVQSSLDRKEESVQDAAAWAYASLSKYCLFNESRKSVIFGSLDRSEKWLADLCDNLASHLSASKDRIQRRGSALAMGRYPLCILSYEQFRKWAASFSIAIKAREGVSADAEARRNAVNGLVHLLSKFDASWFNQGIKLS
jgi:tubulin-specific chaperone D